MVNFYYCLSLWPFCFPFRLHCFCTFVCLVALSLTQSMYFRSRDPAMIEFFSYPCLQLKVSSRGSLDLSGKLPTYPSPKLTLTLTSHLEQNVGLGEG